MSLNKKEMVQLKIEINKVIDSLAEPGPVKFEIIVVANSVKGAFNTSRQFEVSTHVGGYTELCQIISVRPID